MAWESHLSARTGFSSSLIGSEVPAEMERAEVVRCPRRPTTRTLPACILQRGMAPFISALSQLYLSCAAALFQLYRGFISLGRGFIPLLTHR